MSTYKVSQLKGPSTRDLSPPRVPAATANGGLRWADLQDPLSAVIVQIVLSPGTIFIDDLIDLYWQELPVANTTVKQEHLNVGIITLLVPPESILEHDDGPHTLHYIATAAIGGGTTPSDSATVEVKRLIPGGYDSDAGTEYINEDLAAPTGIPELIDDEIAEQGLTVTIPVYLNMAVGDRPQLDWGGQRLSHEPLTLEDVGKPVTFRVEKDVLILRPGPVTVRYEVRDKVNNWSKWSLSTITNVEAGDDLLAAPRVIDAINGIIDLAVLGDEDVRVQTPVYSGMNTDDEVVLTWAGETAEGVGVPVVQNTVVKEIGWPLDFDIPNEKVRAIAQGHVVVSYIVNPAISGPPKPSRRSPRVDVIGQTMNLPEPQVAGVIGGVLDPSTLPNNGATVTILANDLIKAGNTITLVWDGVTAVGTQLPYRDAFPVTGSMEGKDISRQIPLTNIIPLLNGSVTVSYVLNKEGVELPSDLLSLQIKSQGAQLPIPTIDFTQGDALNPDDVPASGTYVRINYSPMETSDRIDMYWDSVHDFADFFPVPVNWNNKEVVFPITKDYVDLNSGQTVEVFYTVTRAGVLLPASIKQPLLIGGALELPGGPGGLPFVLWSEQLPLGDSYPDAYGLNKESSFDGSKIEIPFYDNKKSGDKIDYTYIAQLGGFVGQPDGDEIPSTIINGSYIVPLAEVTTASYITLPASGFFEMLASTPIDSVGFQGSGKIEYTVTPEGSTVATPALPTKINIDTRSMLSLSIDPTPVVLSAVLVRIDVPVPNPPPGTFMTREARGGVPPYQYAALHPDIVEINAQGSIISKNNGSTTITATDQEGATVSYKVTVSSVLNLFAMGVRYHYPNIEALVANMGGRVPSIAEWLVYLSAYNYVAQADIAWASNVSGPNRYTINVSTGEVGIAPGGMEGPEYTGYGVK